MVLAVAAALLIACSGGGSHWRTTDISGVMPPLRFTLTDGSTGRVVHAADFRGKVVLLYFGYTHCPDVCPTTLANLAASVRALGARASQVRILFVSVDPARDTPAVLQQYAAAFGPRVVGLHGNQAELRSLTKRYRVSYGYGKPDAHGDYEVSHSSAVYVFDARGNVRLLARPTDRPQDIAHDLGRLIADG